MRLGSEKSRIPRTRGTVMVETCTGGKVIVHFAASWLRQPRFKQADYAFRRGKDMLQKRLFYMFSHMVIITKAAFWAVDHFVTEDARLRVRSGGARTERHITITGS